MHTTLLLDIYSGSVGVGIAGIEENSLPKIIYAFRKDFGSGEQAMFGALSLALHKAFKEGVPLISHTGFPKIFDHVVITLSEPWALSSYSVQPGHSDDIFEQVKIGSGTLTSTASKDLIHRIENEVIKTMGIKRGASIQSFAYVFFKVFSSFSGSSEPTMLVRFSGGKTEVISLKAKEIRGLSVLHFGPDTISRHLGDKMDLPKELSRSMLSIFARGALDREKTIRVDALLSSLEERWSEKWEELESLKAKQVFIVANDEDSALAEALISSVIPGAEITDLKDDNFFAPHIAKGKISDLPVSILASFSRLLL